MPVIAHESVPRRIESLQHGVGLAIEFQRLHTQFPAKRFVESRTSPLPIVRRATPRYSHARRKHPSPSSPSRATSRCGWSHRYRLAGPGWSWPCTGRQKERLSRRNSRDRRRAPHWRDRIRDSQSPRRGRANRGQNKRWLASCAKRYRLRPSNRALWLRWMDARCRHIRRERCTGRVRHRCFASCLPDRRKKTQTILLPSPA